VLKVAVIGAGAAGLVTARELTRAGHEVTVFEQGNEVGGTWIYRPESEPDPLGQTGSRIHSSMYASMRTNLPRDVMAFFDYTFDSSGGGKDDWPRYPGHKEVLQYLERFARAFSVHELIRFGTRVLRVRNSEYWQVTTEHSGQRRTASFDAVAVCNGHYHKPRIPAIPGLSEFPGTVLHSHNYRQPECYTGGKVAVFGGASSAADLSQEIAGVAEHVYLCADLSKQHGVQTRHRHNIERRPSVSHLFEDGRILFADNTISEPVDHFIFATGYHYSFPFLDSDVIKVTDNHVTPLRHDLLCIDHPTLALIGLPFKIIPFPIFEIQARWFSRLLNREFVLPSRDAMRDTVADHVAQLDQAGVNQRNRHSLEDGQYDYYDRLAGECADPPLPQWYRSLGEAARQHVRRWPESFRDQPLGFYGAPTRCPNT